MKRILALIVVFLFASQAVCHAQTVAFCTSGSCVQAEGVVYRQGNEKIRTYFFVAATENETYECAIQMKGPSCEPEHLECEKNDAEVLSKNCRPYAGKIS